MRGVVLVVVVIIFTSTQAVEYRHQEHDGWEKGNMKGIIYNAYKRYSHVC